MSNRIEKVNSLLEREISKILLRDFAFPDNALVTLTRVQATPNLIEARVYVSVYFARRSSQSEGGSEENAEEIVKNLNRNVYDIQQKINRLLRMRPIPRIRFVGDKTISQAGKIEELLEKLKEQENN